MLLDKNKKEGSIMKPKKKMITKFVIATSLFTAGSIVVPVVGSVSAYAATTGPVQITQLIVPFPFGNMK